MTARRRASIDVAALAVLALEVLGSLLMWAPIPVAWVWVGARAYDASGSFVAGACVWFAGFLASLWLIAAALARIDRAWIALRRRAGHEQRDGALTRVVVVTATIALAAFFLWFYVLQRA